MGQNALAAPQPAGTNSSSAAEPSFHDIKPLPEFHPLNWTLLLAALVVLVGALLAYLLYRKTKRYDQREALPPPPPDAAALRALFELDQKRRSAKIIIRQFAAELSQILRTFLEQTLNFPASDQTISEIRRTLPAALSARLPVLNADSNSSFIDSALKILSFCQQATFADYAEHRYPLQGQLTGEMLEAATALVKTLAQEKREELKRQHQLLANSSPVKTTEAEKSQ